ncbi:DUF1878 family protein [Alkalihalobacillus sp. AL-G]|uniref:DUF1878 family protein n=1 Tax=Alkalihalobacillus sp. AL-G TaxID=2926399 RepID=UPI00272C4330|nr:DUF1878 family protein [Alkalihalobacillus sp. AL-G]WLD94075.1 YhaI family protein [Alkalihalobacillus sp. AL-G]
MFHAIILGAEQEVVYVEESEKENVKRLEFYQRMLGETVDAERYPWFRLVMEINLSEDEVTEVFNLFNILGKQKEELREAGLLDLTPLLLHFVGMLNAKLDPLITAKSLHHQGHFQELNNDLIRLLKKYPSNPME